MKKKTIIIIVLALLLAVALGVIAWLLTRRKEPADLDPAAVTLASTAQDAQVPSGIQIPGYPRLRVDGSTGRVDVLFENPEGNPCYFALTLTRSDTGEVLWQSSRFKPGSGIQNPTLTVIPPPGTYAATLTYTTTSIKDERPLNGAVINTQLDVY